MQAGTGVNARQMADANGMNKKAPFRSKGGFVGTPATEAGGLTRATFFAAGYRAKHIDCCPHRSVGLLSL
ncbi:hypothetical protein JCM15764A_12030 [Geotalea toluenoxydans]